MSPPTDQTIVHELITYPAVPSLTLSLKPLLWEPSGSSGLLSMSYLLCTCNKCCSFLHRNLVSVDWLYTGRCTKVCFSNTPFPADNQASFLWSTFLIWGAQLSLLPLFKSCHQGPDQCLPLSWDCAFLEISITKLYEGLLPRLSAPVSVAPSNGKCAALGYLWYITCSHISKCPE